MLARLPAMPQILIKLIEMLQTDAAGMPELAALIGNAPWVQCAEYADAGAVSCVGINDVDASQHAVSQLADGGRKRIAMINHDLSYKYARLRERGYKSVIHLRDLDYQAVEYASDLSSGAGMAAMQNLLKDNPPDAVFAVSDTLAAGALCPECGRAVEESIRSDGLRLADLNWLKRVRLGVTLTIIGLLTYFALRVADICMMVLVQRYSSRVPRFYEVVSYIAVAAVASILLRVLIAMTREPGRAESSWLSRSLIITWASVEAVQLLLPAWPAYLK